MTGGWCLKLRAEWSPWMPIEMLLSGRALHVAFAGEAQCTASSWRVPTKVQVPRQMSSALHRVDRSSKNSVGEMAKH